MTEPTVLWEIDAILGEGPVWVAAENAVYWVDIFSDHVHRYSFADGAKQTWTFEERVTSVSPRQGGGFVASVRDGFAKVDFENNSIEPIDLMEADIANNRFNDGKVDAQGRYWAGTMDVEQTAKSGSLYRMDADMSVHKMDDGYIITNGPAFNKDGSIMYHTETLGGVVYAFDLSSDGSISNKRVFTEFNEAEVGLPDGMTVDSDDHLWVAHFGGSRITRYSPTGEIVDVIKMPVPNITSCTFVGDALDTMVITTARVGIDEDDLPNYPQAGSLFICKPGVTGLPTPLFAG